MNYHVQDDQDINIDYESPKRDLPPWRATALPNGLSALDTVNAPRAPPQEIKTATLPLLSPVFEKQTPSASRHLETNKSNNGIKGNNKEHHQQGRRASLTWPLASITQSPVALHSMAHQKNFTSSSVSLLGLF
jgi:hypothetical protein